jgi:hypothetical protein
MSMRLSLLFLILMFFLVQCDDEDPGKARVATGAVTDLTHESAVGSGEVLNNGGASVTARGVCWNTTGEPTIADFSVEAGEGVGPFTASLTDLDGSTTYYVRAFAINKAGVSYGDEVSFTTLPTPTIPELTTTPISEISSSSAKSGGTITNNGNAAITARGICWSTTSPPTVNDFKTVEGVATSAFESVLSSLDAGTTYYVRSYATNSAGTGYGNELSFSTNSITATLYATKDATIFNNQAGNATQGNYGAGGDQLLQVGYASPTQIYARTLLQFDLSSIPSDAVIESVSLQFTAGSSGSFTPTVTVHRLTQGWTEGTTTFCSYSGACNVQGAAIAPGGTDVTWNETSYSGASTNGWTTSGGTFTTTASGSSVDAGATILIYTSDGLKNDVASWVATPGSNFGWIMKTDWITNSSAMRRFRSREGATAAGDATTAPKLVIVYH